MAHRYWRIYITGSASNVASIGELYYFDSGGSLLTGSGTASASSVYPGGYVAANAFDGNVSTFWNSNGDPNTGSEWLAYDFGSAVSPASAMIVGRLDTLSQSPALFKFQYSDDGSSWTDLDTHTTTWGGDQPTAQSFALDTPSAGHYLWWRARVTSVNGGTAAASIAELVWYSGGSPVTVNATGTPTSDGVSAAHDSFSGQSPYQAFDGNPATFWGSSSSPPVWLAHVFPKAYAMDRVTITSRGDSSWWSSQSPVDFAVQGSNDGASWTTVESFTASSWTGPGQTQSFDITSVAAAGGSYGMIL